MRNSIFNKKYIIISLNVVLVILTIEISTRIGDYFKWGAGVFANYSSDSLVVTDQYGTHSAFNATYEKWRINKYGFRGPDIEFKKNDHVKRIVIFGASETFGLYESENKEFPSQVRLLLDRMKPSQYQILNAASPGISPPRATQFYQLWVSKFKPDLVIYYPSPVIYLDEAAPRGANLQKINRQTSATFQFRFVRNLRNLVKQHMPEALQNYFKNQSIQREVGRHPKGWVWEKPPPDRLELFKQHLTEFVVKVRESHAVPILMTHVNRFSSTLTEKDRTLMISWRKFYPRASEECLIGMDSAANDIIREIGMKYNVTIIDLDRTLSRDAKYFADHVHLTDAGAESIAYEIIKAIVSFPVK